MTSESAQTSGANRRTFVKRATAVAAVPAAASLIAGLPGTASASDSPSLPDYAPVPATSAGPALNADGYFVGHIKGNLYWVTDSYYQAMFLTTRDGRRDLGGQRCIQWCGQQRGISVRGRLDHRPDWCRRDERGGAAGRDGLFPQPAQRGRRH